MNEQNGNLNQTNGVIPEQTPVNQTPTPQPVQVMENINTINPGVIPTPEPVQPVQPVQAAQPVQTPVAPLSPEPVAQPVQQPVAPQPVATPAPVQTPQPVAEPVPQPVQQPVAPVEPAPQPTTIAQPVQSVAPTPQPEVAAQPSPTDINGQPIVQNEFNSPSTTSSNTYSGSGVFGPSHPISDQNNMTGVGFVAAGEDLPKKKNKKLKIIIIVIILLGLAAIGYFVVYPYIVKNFMNDPKNVYSATINEAFKQINNTIDDVVHEKAIYDIELSLNSDIKALEPYSGYKYGINAGIDPSNKNLQLGYTIKTDNNVEYSAFTYIKDNKIYERYSNYRDEKTGNIGLLYVGEADSNELDELFNSFKEILNSTENVSKDDLTYLTNKLSKTIINSIDEKKLSKEDASITINNETLKVTNNIYEFDKDNQKRTIKYIVDELKNDDKTIEILAKITETDKDKVKASFDVNTDEMEFSDDTIYFNIYTYGRKNDVIGYGINDANEEIEFQYFRKDEKHFEASLYMISNNEETGKKEENKLEVVGNNNSDEHKVTVKVNGEDVIILDINTWDEKTKDFKYTIKDSNGDITGNIKYVKDKNNDRLKITFDFSVKVSKNENLSVSLAITEDWSSTVANINISTATAKEENELEEIRNKFTSDLLSTSIGTLFQTVSGVYSPEIGDYYGNGEETPNESETPTDTGEDL